MKSIQFCKKLLESGGGYYDEKDVKAIRGLLYQIGEIDYQQFKDYLNEQEGNPLYSCLN